MLLFTACAGGTGVKDGAESSAAAGEVAIGFDFIKQSGSASNQYAVWIEDMNGRVIKTLCASSWTVDGGYKTRPDSIAVWAERAGLANMSAAEVDAISCATPRTSRLSYSWDLTGEDGKPVPPGDYKFFVEGTLRWKNYVLYSGVITIGDTSCTANAVAEYYYQGSDRYDALNEDSTENRMIRNVTAAFTPAEEDCGG